MLNLIQMEELAFIFANATFAFIFAILGLFSIFLHIPKEDDYKYYRKSRYTLGIGFFVMVGYCVLRMALPPNKIDEFTSFSIQMFFSLAFSWLTYSSFMYIIYVEKYKRKRFLADGIAPLVLMSISIAVGMKYPQIQHINTIIFGVIFGLKCFWMAYSCIVEYNRCIKDLDNYYSNSPDISWMRNMLFAVIFLSVFTMIYFYVRSIEMIFYPIFFSIYVYLVFKLINYLPVKISRLRKESAEEEQEKKETAKPSVDLKQKLEEPVRKWVNEKKFVKPNITIKDAALEIGTNHNYLSKYINSFLGMTFSSWLHTLRIEESKALLTGPEKISIEEIGQKVGIPEIYNFSRWFKTITGMTPQQYRRANKA